MPDGWRTGTLRDTRHCSCRSLHSTPGIGERTGAMLNIPVSGMYAKKLGHAASSPSASWPRWWRLAMPEKNIYSYYTALTLCKEWVESEEGRTLGSIIAIDDFALMNGKQAWNERFIAMCRALDKAVQAGVKEQGNLQPDNSCSGLVESTRDDLKTALNIGLAALGYFNTEQTDKHWNKMERELREIEKRHHATLESPK